VELSAPPGSAVRAAADGLVLYTGDLPRRGRTVVVAHENGWVTAYAGVEEVAVEAFAMVERGAWIGLVGARGLRFEVVDRGTPRDPRPLFAQVPALPSRP
jgi:murein DD-endopeptidase MepM/ murein hydrolase activator NlpD